MSATPVERVLQRARSYVGQHEVPMGSNTGPFVLRCQRSTNLAGTRWPWCGALDDLVFTEEGMPFPPSAPTASAFGMDRWARKVGWSIPKPKPGALAVVNHGAGHICLVEDVQGVWVHTIDGNVSDSVAPRVRHVSEFRGFIWHPALSKKPVVVPKLRPPLFEVVTSESGHTKVVFRGPRSAVGKWILNTRIGDKFPAGITIRRGKK